MKIKYSIEKENYGPTLRIQGKWNHKFVELIRDKKIKGLALNYAWGWQREDLSFLKEVPELESFFILDWNVNDISGIHYLKNLRSLVVNTYCKTEINFHQFPKLEYLTLEWRPKAKSIFESKSLESVYVNHYSEHSMSKFNQMEQLTSLRVGNSPLYEIGDLSNLKRLEHLGIYYATKLTSLKGIETLKNLKKLEVTHCRKITDINSVSQLKELEYLDIGFNGNIQSLLPVRNLKNLEKVFFPESTNIMDGKIAFLKTLPKFKDTAFYNRKHYDCKNHEIGEDADGIPIEQKIKEIDWEAFVKDPKGKMD